MTRWLPVSLDDLKIVYDPIKIFNDLKQLHWNVIKCPVCGKLGVARFNFVNVIHFAVDHTAFYEVHLTKLTYKQAREISNTMNVFGFFIKDQKNPEEWDKAIKMLDDLAGVDKSKFEQK